MARFDFPTTEKRGRKGWLCESLLLCPGLLPTAAPLITKVLHTFCASVQEDKPVAVLEDQKLFLMGNIESAELKTAVCVWWERSFLSVTAYLAFVCAGHSPQWL